MRRWTLNSMAAAAAFIVVASGAKSFSAQRAGFGIETPTGYQVSNVKYWLGGESTIRSVNFDLDAPAHTVTTRLQVSGEWYECAPRGPRSWSCPFPESQPLTMNDADTFQVRAY